jgi:hypothetical protein
MARFRPRIQIRAYTKQERVSRHTAFMRKWFALQKQGISRDKAYGIAYLSAYGLARYRMKFGCDPSPKTKGKGKPRKRKR